MLKEIGHDGSEIIYPDQPEPRRRRSFHVQECLQVLDRRGYAATPFHALSDLILDDTHKLELSFASDFENHLAEGCGVITGQGQYNRHAVAYANRTVYDPNGYEYNYDSLIDHTVRGVFIPETFWKIKSFS